MTLAVGQLEPLALRQETAPPVERDTKKSQEAMFRVVQEPKNAGKEEGDYLGLCFFLGEEPRWKIHDRSGKIGRSKSWSRRREDDDTEGQISSVPVLLKVRPFTQPPRA